MPIIAITNRKGGVGKTTLTANLAVEFMELGYSVKVIDTDPQKSLCKWADFGDGLLKKIVSSISTKSPAHFQVAIKEAQKHVQIILIDSPPAFADVALLATLLADIILIPVGPSAISLIHGKETLDLILNSNEHRNKKPRIYFVPNNLISRANSSLELSSSLKELGASVLPGIHHRTLIADSSSIGLSIAEMDPKSPGRYEFQAIAKALEEKLK